MSPVIILLYMENSDPIDMNTLGNALANGDNDCKVVGRSEMISEDGESFNESTSESLCSNDSFLD